MNELREILKIYAEIEFNATEDTLFERMTLDRLQNFIDKHFETHLREITNDECSEMREFMSKGHTEEEWRIKRRSKRVKWIRMIT